jgi:regulator of protease activity HflC (stomatin/prohibitin superfamily)
MSLWKKLTRKPSVMHTVYDKMREGPKAAARAAQATLEEATAKTEAAKLAADAQYKQTADAKLANEKALANMQMNAAKVSDANNNVGFMSRLTSIMAGGSASAVSTSGVGVGVDGAKKKKGKLSEMLGIRL